MATPEYPSTLPGPGTFTVEPTSQVLATEAELGPKAFRRRSRQPGAFTSVSFRFLETDYSVFIEWWRTTLKYGHKWFWIQLPSAGGITWHVARFAERYAAKLDGHRYWNVTAKLELRERQFEPNDLLMSVLRENFENGISDWQTKIGGANSTAFFSIGASPYGSKALFGAKITSIGAYDRRRKFYLTEEQPFNRFQCKGMMPTGGNANDDSPSLSVINAAGTVVFGMQISREVSYDAQQRPVFNLGSEILFPGTVRIPYDVWMEFNISINPGAGQSTYLVRRLDTNAVWATGNFVNDHGSSKFGAGLQIYSEASGGFTSQAGYIDDLICWYENA